MAMYGARNEAIALTNWPKVKELANLSPLMILLNSGFNDVCIRAFPIPNKENEQSISI